MTYPEPSQTRKDSHDSIFLSNLAFSSALDVSVTDKHQKRKSCLILDVERYRYQEYISDIAGQDIKAHKGETRQAISAVRGWLGESLAGINPPPGVAAIFKRFELFIADLPAICAATDREVDDLTFTEFADTTSTWLRTALARPK